MKRVISQTNLYVGFTVYIVFQSAIAVQQESTLQPKYASKTSYDLSFTNKQDMLRRTLPWKELLQPISSPLNTHPMDLESCQPEGLYVVYRRGTTYKKKSRMEVMHSLINKIKTSDTVHPAFRNLPDISDITQSGTLSETGKDEMGRLAQRLKTRFPELFPNPLHLQDYSFKSTNHNNTIDSAVAFIGGLAGPDKNCLNNRSTNTPSVYCTNDEKKLTIPLQNDPLLMFSDTYKHCKKDQDHVDSNGKPREDVVFLTGEEVHIMSERLAARLTAPGSRELFNLSRDDALELISVCAFQQAWYNESSWCSLLTPDDLRVFEYKNDLKHYWTEGYGHPVNYMVGCNLMGDIINYLEQLTNKESKAPTAVFKFEDHTDAVLSLQCLLGLNKDDHSLQASDFQKNMNRKFRTSQIAPMAANVAFVLFKCSSEGKHPETESRSSKPSYKMTVLVNELPIELPFCQNSSVCDLKDVKTYVEHTMGKCNFNKTCCIENCKGMHNVLGLVGICLLVFACVVFVIITMKYSIPMAREKYRRYRGNQGHVMLVNEAAQL